MKNDNCLIKITGWIFIVFIVSNCSKKVENAVNKTIALKTFDATITSFASATAGGLVASRGDLPLSKRYLLQYNTRSHNF